MGDVVNNGELAFNRADSVTFAGAVSGSGSLRQLGSGMLTLTGANTYSGGTIVSAGTLRSGFGGIGTGTLTIQGGAEFQLDSATDGDFTTVLAANPTSTFSQIGVGAITYSSGTFGDFNVGAGVANINGPVVVAGPNGLSIASGATLSGTGLIAGDVQNDGVVAPGNSVGTLTIDGDYVHGADATLRIEFDSTPASDLLSVSGDVTLLGGTLEFLSLGGAEGAAMGFLEWGGVLTGSFDRVIAPGGGAIAISIGDDSAGGRTLEDGHVGVVGSGAGSIIRSLTQPSPNSIQAASPVVLTARPSTPNAQAAMLRRTTMGALDAVFSELQREESGAWGRGFADDLTRGAVGDSRGFDYTARGAIHGVHRTDENGLSAGFALGAAKDEALLDVGAGRSRGDAVFGAAYVGFQAGPNFAAAGVALSTQSMDVNRTAQEESARLASLESEAEGRSFAVFSSAGRRFELSDWSLVASGELAYVGTTIGAYDEAGLSDLRLAFSGYDTHSLVASVGVFAEQTSRIAGLPLHARVGARLSNESALDDREINVTFLATGDRATMNGDRSSRTVVSGVAGLTLEVTEDMALSGDVSMAGGDEDRSAVSIGAQWRF